MFLPRVLFRLLVEEEEKINGEKDENEGEKVENGEKNNIKLKIALAQLCSIWFSECPTAIRVLFKSPQKFFPKLVKFAASLYTFDDDTGENSKNCIKNDQNNENNLNKVSKNDENISKKDENDAENTEKCENGQKSDKNDAENRENDKKPVEKDQNIHLTPSIPLNTEIFEKPENPKKFSEKKSLFFCS